MALRTLALGLAIALNTWLYAKAKRIPISGWPTQDLGSQAIFDWLGNDPVLGRMTCPPLTRLNLQKKRSELVLLRELLAKPAANGQWLWQAKMRSDIYWWGGKQATNADLRNFLANNLRQLAEKKGFTDVPKFDTRLEGGLVEVQWESRPGFGPYLLNGLAFSAAAPAKQKSALFGRQCVGPYKARMGRDRVLLDPNVAQRKGASANYFTYFIGSRTKEGISFSMAGDFEEVATSQQPVERSCRKQIDLPMFSAIIWNPQAEGISDTKLRREISSLFPRKTIVRFGLLGLGKVNRSVIPIGHPGFRHTNRGNMVKKIGQGRLLVLSSATKKISLLEKLIIDVLRVSDFRVKFEAKAKISEVSGYVSGFIAPWPEMDLWKSFHSNSNTRLVDGTSRLDRLLSEYRQALTTRLPDFEKLAAIQSFIDKNEWITVIAQHQACVTGPLRLTSQAETKDPDWFITALPSKRLSRD